MEKKLIKITESDLHKIIENSVKRIIKEDIYDDYDDDYNEMNDMSTDEKWNNAIESVGAERVLQELEQWLDTDTKEEFLNDFSRLVLNN